MFKTKKSRPEVSLGTRTYTSSDVSNIAAVSLRQLQWWDERKVVSPRHEGHRRVYFPAEVIEITVIAELRRKGFSLQKIRRVLRFLQREMGKRLADLMQANSNLHLVTDGKSIYLEDQHERIIDIIKNARQPMFLVCVTDQARRLDDIDRRCRGRNFGVCHADVGSGSSGFRHADSASHRAEDAVDTGAGLPLELRLHAFHHGRSRPSAQHVHHGHSSYSIKIDSGRCRRTGPISSGCRR